MEQVDDYDLQALVPPGELTDERKALLVTNYWDELDAAGQDKDKLLAADLRDRMLNSMGSVFDSPHDVDSLLTNTEECPSILS